MVIDNAQQFDEIKDHAVFIIPIPEDDRYHTSQTSIIALAIYDLETSKSYIISLSHPEAVYHMRKIDIGKFTSYVYCTNIPLMWKHFDNNTLAEVSLIDFEMMKYLKTGKKVETETNRMALRYTQNMPGCKKINTLVSLLKLQERTDSVLGENTDVSIPMGLHFYANKVRGVFNWIESNGLHIDKEKYKERFGKTFSRIDDMCYTQYNYYTTTGRPSNRFGGVNYAALPKDKTRECFVSRYGDEGCLMELDFNSYHPRIIASLIGYDFGKDNVYEHLAKHYHNTDSPTKDQIAKAKEDTFRQLYGGIRKKYLNIPFFAKTDAFVKSLYKEMKCGYVESLISHRRLHDHKYKEVTPYTFFNYYIQMMETEFNVEMLNTMSEHFVQSGIKGEPILYTYDSVLFDIHKDHKDLLTKEIIPASVDLAKFPIKWQCGNNYRNLSVYVSN